MFRKVILVGVVTTLMGALSWAQDNRPPSPRGTASAQVLGKWVKPDTGRAFTLGGANYQGGKWIEISYGRPLKRGRDVYGTGANYGKDVLVGAPIWRAGADQSTLLKTEVPLLIGGKTVAPGTYCLFIDLKENNWTFVVSTWPTQQQPAYEPNNKAQIWGAYGYTPDKDVLRTPMTLEALPHSIEELTWGFLDMTDNGGTLALSWGKTMGSVAFKVDP